MPRYIDADLIEYHDSFTNDGEYTRVAFGDDIDVLPTADVVEVKHGEWKQISPAKIYECSVCGQLLMSDDIDIYHFCHGCGAKMDGGTW